MFDSLIAQVKEFKAAQLSAAKNLKSCGAPLDQVNARKVAASNAVAKLEKYIMNVNAAKEFGHNEEVAAQFRAYAEEALIDLNKFLGA